MSSTSVYTTGTAALEGRTTPPELLKVHHADQWGFDRSRVDATAALPSTFDITPSFIGTPPTWKNKRSSDASRLRDRLVIACVDYTLDRFATRAIFRVRYSLHCSFMEVKNSLCTVVWT